ncbi:iron-containing alcohol dehydrogenase [Leptospira sp. GIMC2001]|uniref:iron-containing alcohol dehydrogenase n=1 Tax=Leptospira sp. GIMC2001 TaxID=1513297 RepID=UPI00234B4A4F|nr:iron-containing alcohol dehydrogenase [Leptospira sp. GIMC2001]WCL48572.1 iron-containing alcohol dehydrogenase [Leptospira sp. GIMC2001]
MPVLPEWINFNFPPKIHFEIDCTYKSGTLVKNVGSRIILLSTQSEMENPDELTIIKTSLEKHADGVIVYDDIEKVANFKDLDSASYFARIANANCIVVYGGFESINAGKAIALLATNDCFAEELFGGRKAIKNPPLPLVVIPTRPVMGNEASPFLTITDDRDRNRKYISHEWLFPTMIICDPKISVGLSTSDIAKTGIAILSAAVDSLLSKYSNDLTNSNALRAIELVSKNIIPAIRESKNMGSRSALYSASLLTGIAQSVSSLGLCYALSLSASTITNLDIYQSMAILLPHVMEYNLTSSAGKYVHIAKALDEDVSNISVIEAAIKAVEGIRKIYLELKIPQRLSEYEVKKIDLPGIATLASTYSFLDSLPRELPKNEIETILVAAY